ncbi:MAG: hypothetical protein A2046_06825 [Bacteroidetes bacterium GWA2_30_7]|nr:MAG: hypothetical protein A2046_06825 [Bacteroidetes bacterium GWA2_30_7]
MKIISTGILFILLESNLFSQNKLTFKTESLDSLLIWMQNGCAKNNISNLANLSDNHLMQQLLNEHETEVITFEEALNEFNYKDSTSGSLYLLNDAYKKRIEITELLNKIKNANFSDEVYNRADKYFPDNYTPPRNYEVYFTCTGWKWGDAMTFNYINSNGKYFVSNQGTPAIIFNLTLVCMTYGNTLSEQMDALKDVMSHELFHAIFSDYIKSNWLVFDNENVGYNTLYMMLNEGLAHYISDGKLLIEGYNNGDKLKQKEKEAFNSFLDSSKVIFNDKKNIEVRNNALNSGLFGKYWEKYICITGLFIAYHIEQYYGKEGLRECIKSGPEYFIKKYEFIRQLNKDLPSLPIELTKFIMK